MLTGIPQKKILTHHAVTNMKQHFYYVISKSRTLKLRFMHLKLVFKTPNLYTKIVFN